MLLKRHYDQTTDPPTLTRVTVLHAGPRQRFSIRFLDQGIEAGFLALAGGAVHLKTEPPLVYRVLRVPGLYCCHCGAAQVSAEQARAHVAAAHPGIPSPDPCNRAGYEQIHYYDCEQQKEG